MDDLRAQLNGGDGESSCLAKMAILPRVVFRIVACDIFVSLRVIYLACVVQATAMIISWTHGVMEVVFASLAITFLLEIDDELMTTMVERVELGSPHRAIIASIRHFIAGRVVVFDNSRSTSSKYLGFSPSGAVLTWAVLMVVAVAVLHLYQTLVYSTMIGVASSDPALTEINTKDYYRNLQNRFLPLAAGFFAASALCAICSVGLRSAAASTGAGLCLGWVMAAVYSGVNNGLLYDLWNSFDLERGPGVLGGDGIGLMVFISSGLFGFDQPGLAGVGPGMFFPALISAHLTWSIARPIVALLLRPAWGPTEVKV